MATLVRVFPEQINEVWPFVKEAIEKTTKTPSRKKTTEILRSIMIGTYRCWVVMEGDEMCAVALTSTVGGFGIKHLLLHTFYIYKRLTGLQYVELWKQFKKLAQAGNCEDVVFYTDNEKLCEFVERHGATISKFVSIPV